MFTRAEVVDFILDLVGYTADQPLHRTRILEPSFGNGDFLLAIVGRLLQAWRSSGDSGSIVNGLGDAIRAVELHRETFAATRLAVIERLRQEGVPNRSVSSLADRWLVVGDFLLTPFAERFHFVPGNPPYVRQELIPPVLLAEYRTLYDRADLYIPFIERSLSLLTEGGSLGFICSDRWMKNRYGGPLRKLVADRFHLAAYVDMVNTPAFHSDVIAYPAITVVRREQPGPVRIAHRPSTDRATLGALAAALLENDLPKKNDAVRELAQVTHSADPRLLEAPDQMGLPRRLEREFPTLEEADCKVGIGVATGSLSGTSMRSTWNRTASCHWLPPAISPAARCSGAVRG